MTSPVRLSNHARDCIIGSAMKGAFDAEEKANLKKLSVLAMKCYRKQTTAAQEKVARQTSTEWLMLTNSLTLRFYRVKEDGLRGSYIEQEAGIQVDSPVPFRGEETRGHVNVVDNALYQQFEAIDAVRDAISEKRDQLRDQIRQLVYSTGSVKKLIEMWPEVEAFLPADLTAPKSYLPATLSSDINATLREAGIKVGAIAAPKQSGGLVLVAA
jgi:hypothetical protein